MPPTISIELERKNGAYFPGETVEGCVKINVTQPTKTSGVFLDFLGKASSEWTEGESEEDKKTLTGETVFQHQVLTLQGDTYETGALRTTGQVAGKNFQGEAIDFDKTPGLGTVYIPCDEEERETLKLKAWTLGSVTNIDVKKQLVDEERPRSFFLQTTTGNMTKGPVKISGEFRPYKDVFPLGSDPRPLVFALTVHQLKGVPRGTKDVKIRITREPCGSGEDEEKKGVIAEQSTVAKRSVKVEEVVSSILLPMNETVYPFSLKIRDDGPGSWYWQKDDSVASVSYELKAFIGWQKQDPKFKKIITVLPARPLPRGPILSPYQMETGDQPLTKGFCCMPKTTTYTVAIKLCLSRLCYAPGEVMDLTGSQVVNNSDVAQPAQVVLRCFVAMTGGYGSKRNMSHDYILYETEIPPKETVLLTNVPNYHSIRVPSVAPSYSGQHLNVAKTEVENACLKFAYTLEIRLVDWGNGFYSRTPILISSAPPYSHQLRQFRDVKADPLLTDQWSIFQQALSGRKDTELAPTLKKSKDIAKLTKVIQKSPIWIGEMRDYDEWIRDEDNKDRLAKWIEGNKDADLEKLFYRPVVNTFAGPSRDRSISSLDIVD